MVRQGSGRIINVGSHAFLGIFGGAGYPAAKGGIISLTRAMARELGRHGVTCNVLCPGAKTRLSSGEAYEEHIRTLHARGTLSDEQRDSALNPPDPALVAPLVLYLATDGAAHVNGQVFSASGGYVGLFPEPKEVLLLYRDARTEGSWTLDELTTLLPPKLRLDS
jgi:NAD(P)-dependent dehydrogenase (short-subunit alcohol dehydrogenase family)